MTATPSELLQPVASELEEFERRLLIAVEDDTTIAANLMRPIVNAGGKRLRPALVMLGANLGKPDMERMYHAAVGIELIHTATLIHDDLIDNAATRRGVPTIHSSASMAAAVVVGDYYLTKGFASINKVGSSQLDQVVSTAVMSICDSELLQQDTQLDVEQTVDSYYSKIAGKTASLLEACCTAAAVVGGLDSEQQEALEGYGYNLGMAFQIADDVLDYMGTAEQLGKPAGSDLAEGTVTIPLLLALDDPTAGHQVNQAMNALQSTSIDVSEVVEMVRRSSGPTEAIRTAREFESFARQRLDTFADSPYRHALAELCDYVITRPS